MITILRLMQYRKDEHDCLVDLYTNGRGAIVDYQRDYPPIELLKIPQSIIESLCPQFLALVVKGNKSEIVLSNENIQAILEELEKVEQTGITEIASSEIIKFIHRYESIKETCHLAYQGCNV